VDIQQTPKSNRWGQKGQPLRTAGHSFSAWRTKHANWNNDHKLTIENETRQAEVRGGWGFDDETKGKMSHSELTGKYVRNRTEKNYPQVFQVLIRYAFLKLGQITIVLPSVAAHTWWTTEAHSSTLWCPRFRTNVWEDCDVSALPTSFLLLGD